MDFQNKRLAAIWGSVSLPGRSLPSVHDYDVKRSSGEKRASGNTSTVALKKLHTEEKECKLKKVKFFTAVILLSLLSMLSCNGCPSVRPSSCQNFEMVPLHIMTSWRDLVGNSRWGIATRNGFKVLRCRFPVMPSSFVCKCFYYMLSFVSLITYLFYI